MDDYSIFKEEVVRICNSFFVIIQSTIMIREFVAKHVSDFV